LGGTINKPIFTGGYFNTWGIADTLLYNTTFCPDSDRLHRRDRLHAVRQDQRAGDRPWFDAKIGLQYVWYNKVNGGSINFDGMGTNARYNNTLHAFVLAAF
jgi:hypothetical protein